MVDLKDGSIRYVGVTNKSLFHRLQEHRHSARCRDKGNIKLKQWLLDCLKREQLLVALIDEQSSVKRELYWIETLAKAGAPLLNIVGVP
jgi:Uri superfamily endonuclease